MYADHHPGYRISTEEEARNWMVELTDNVESARQACDLTTVPREQRKAYNIWVTRHGAALGTLTALHRCGMLSDVAYNELRERVMQTMQPTLVDLPMKEGR